MIEHAGARAPRVSATRILLTGGTGFVGRHLFPVLRAATDGEIVIGGREPDADVRLDLADASSIDSAITTVRPDIVIHLAGEASVASAANAASETWRVNLGGTLALATAFARSGSATTFLFTSSAEVYGDAFLDGEVDERTRPAPQSIYAQSKLAAEHMLAAVLPAQTRLIICRPSNHVGPGQHQRFALPSFARQIAAAESAGHEARILVGNLEAERDFLDVRDVVRTYVALLADPSGRAREVVNISSQTTRSVRSLLDMMRGLASISSTVEIDTGKYRPNDVPRAAVNSDRLRAMTGWRPLIPIDKTMADIMADARSVG